MLKKQGMALFLMILFSMSLLALTSEAQAELSVSQPKLVRGLDGRWIACNRAHHLNRSTWAIDKINVQMTEDELVQLTANVEFQQCQNHPEKPGQVTWLKGNPLAEFTRMNPNGETYTMSHENLAMIFVNLDNDEMASVAAKPESDLAISETFRLGQLLTPSEIAKLKSGEPVSTSITLYPQSSAKVQKAGKDVKTYSPEPWGRFSIQFVLKKN